MSTNPPPPPVPSLIADWSPNARYLIAGNENLSQLTLQVGGDNPVPLNPGDEVAITNVPSDWKVVPGGPEWTWTGKGLTWNGTSPFTVSNVAQTTPPIYLKVTPSTKDGNSVQVQVQLMKSDGTTQLSTAQPIGLSLYTSEPPLAAYAKASAEGPALVVLTNPSAGSYPNSIDCALLAVQEVSQGTQLTLSFHGWDSQGHDVPLSDTLKSEDLKIAGDAYGNPVPFTNNENGTWSASLPDLPPTETLDVTITGLSLSSTTLVLLEVRFETGQVTTSAWFPAYGPYTVGVALDPGHADSTKYTLRNDNPGTFHVYFLDKAVSQAGTPQVPLVWFVLDAGGQEVFPPVAARFSLNGQDPTEQASENPYNIGSNTLCWVDPAKMTIAQCDIDVALITKEIPGPFSLVDSDLSGYDLSGWSNLAGSNFTGSKLDGANLSGDDLTKSNFKNATLVGTNLSGAMLVQCTMDGVKMSPPTDTNTYSGTTFMESSFLGAKIGGSAVTTMNGCLLTDSNFGGATFDNCTFVECTFCYSLFLLATLNKAVFDPSGKGNDLSCGGFAGSTINLTSFNNCDVTSANFSGATFFLISSSGLTAATYEPPTMPDKWSFEGGKFVYTG